MHSAVAKISWRGQVYCSSLSGFNNRSSRIIEVVRLNAWSVLAIVLLLLVRRLAWVEVASSCSNSFSIRSVPAISSCSASWLRTRSHVEDSFIASSRSVPWGIKLSLMSSYCGLLALRSLSASTLIAWQVLSSHALLYRGATRILFDVVIRL